MARGSIIDRIQKAKPAKGQPRISVCFKLIPEVDERIRKLAEDTGLSMSKVVDVATAAMADSLQRSKKKAAP